MASSFLLLQLALLPLNPAAMAFPGIIEFAPSFMPSKLYLEKSRSLGSGTGATEACAQDTPG